MIVIRHCMFIAAVVALSALSANAQGDESISLMCDGSVTGTAYEMQSLPHETFAVEITDRTAQISGTGVFDGPHWISSESTSQFKLETVEYDEDNGSLVQFFGHLNRLNSNIVLGLIDIPRRGAKTGKVRVLIEANCRKLVQQF